MRLSEYILDRYYEPEQGSDVAEMLRLARALEDEIERITKERNEYQFDAQVALPECQEEIATLRAEIERIRAITDEIEAETRGLYLHSMVKTHLLVMNWHGRLRAAAVREARGNEG